MAEQRIAVKVSGVSKTFKLPHEKHNSFKSIFVNIFRSSRTFERQQVVKNISFDIKEGEFFGIVGRNGSGKSTLLKLLAGIYEQDKGHIRVEGKLTPFIELGVGFSPELTGRENVYLNGALFGFSRKEMDELYPSIVEFAELERFMDQKLKNYSSGMQVRLAFSIAIRAKTDVLLLDEVLAVGDAIFQKKCYDYFKQLKRDKKTVIFVSHDSNALLEYCDKGILIEKGEIVCEGKIETVVKEYTDILNKHEAATADSQQEEKTSSRWGTGEAKVESVVLSSGEERKKLFTDADTMISIAVSFKAKTQITSPIYGITITSSDGQRLIATNTMWAKVATNDLLDGESIVVRWDIPNIFNAGTFYVSPAIADNSGTKTFDWLDEAATFKVRKQVHTIAHMNPEIGIHFE